MDNQWKNLFDEWNIEKFYVKHNDCISNCAEISRRSKNSAGTNILKTLGYWLLTAFLSK